jgi:hypothetical protein
MAERHGAYIQNESAWSGNLALFAFTLRSERRRRALHYVTLLRKVAHHLFEYRSIVT